MPDGPTLFEYALHEALNPINEAFEEALKARLSSLEYPLGLSVKSMLIDAYKRGCVDGYKQAAHTTVNWDRENERLRSCLERIVLIDTTMSPETEDAVRIAHEGLRRPVAS